MKISRLWTICVVFLLLMGVLPAQVRSVQALSDSMVISQVYGGGGNSGASLTNDFVELFNRGASPVSLAGWSIQYASATGTGNFGGNPVVALSGTVPPGGYYLVQLSGGVNGVALPTPDALGTINMSATSGKVVLVNTSSGLACNGGSAPCSADQLAQIVDLVGYGSASFFETSPAPGLSNTTANLRNMNGCMETDNNAADFSAGAPAPRNSATPASPCPSGDTAPSVSGIDPADGTVDVPVGANLTITFSEAVNLSGDWFSLACSISGTKTAAVSGGPTSFMLDPDSDFQNGDQCTLSVFAANVSDQDNDDPPDTMAADFSASFTSSDICSLAFTPAYQIQGSGPAFDPAFGGVQTVQGVVVGDYEGSSPALRGFYLQDLSGDGNPATSDGIFVFNGNNDSVSLGEVVRVTGTVAEFQDQTQLGGVSSIVSCGSGSLDPVDVTLPFPTADFPERYEGMLVRLPQTLYVTEHFQLGRFGQVVMSSSERLSQPTNVVAPGAPALALQAANNLNRIIVDDALNNQNPDPILFGRDGNPLSAANTLRGGDTATGIVGLMTYTWAGNSASGNAYRVRPIGALGGGVPNFIPANPRPENAPARDGSLRVAGMNVLNFFNTFDGSSSSPPWACTLGVGGDLTDCRGADDQAEFERQWPKTVAAVVESGADVIGIIEIENDGYGPDSAIQFLVDRLNDASAPGTYAFIDADAATGQLNALGTDAIKVGLIYKPAAVTPIGQTAALNTEAFVNGGDSGSRNRPVLAQAFQTPDGGRFVAAVNHLKSKGSACDLPDQGDGQGNCSQVRLNAANLMASWLASDPTGTGNPGTLILGDLNSYAMEDPIAALQNAGYTNLLAAFNGGQAYTYVFDGQWGYLDHAMADSRVLSQVTGVHAWHINSDEPGVLDYNVNFKSAGQIASLYAPDEFRNSDHDLVLVDLDLINSPPELGALVFVPGLIPVGGSVQASAAFSDPDPLDTHTAVWDWGDGSTSAGVVSEAGGAGLAEGFHTYSTPGTFRVRLLLEDNFSNQAQGEYEFVVVYDPAGGSALGSGTVDSPPGAYPANPSLDGKLGFGFMARYERGASVPTGRLEAVLKNAGLRFESSSFDWLVISGSQAWLRGSGLLNGQPGYQFRLWAESEAPAKVRLRIWQVVDGQVVVVYDNQELQPLSAGKIVILGR